MLSGRHVIVGLGIAVVLAAIVAGLVVVGSPGEERLRRMDDRRVRDLVAITHAVNSYWTTHAKLPASLDDLLDSPGMVVETGDPLTAKPYGFTVLGAKTYELCAEFQHESSETEPAAFGRFWAHGVGRRCFRLEANAAPRN